MGNLARRSAVERRAVFLEIIMVQTAIIIVVAYLAGGFTMRPIARVAGTGIKRIANG